MSNPLAGLTPEELNALIHHQARQDVDMIRLYGSLDKQYREGALIFQLSRIADALERKPQK